MLSFSIWIKARVVVNELKHLSIWTIKFLKKLKRIWENDKFPENFDNLHNPENQKS